MKNHASPGTSPSSSPPPPVSSPHGAARAGVATRVRLARALGIVALAACVGPIGCAAVGSTAIDGPSSPARERVADSVAVSSEAGEERQQARSLAALEWTALAELEELEFSFHDTDRNATVHVTGPYRVTYWDADRVDLVGQVDTGSGAVAFGEEAKLTLLRAGEQLWAQVTMVDAQYLTRVH